MIRLSTNSLNEDIFTQNMQDYEIALKIEDMKKNSYIKVKKTIQIYRIKVIIRKGKFYGSHLHTTWL